ncbi:MAG TPA: glycoside hydrolase family 38 C-terminal domain-containing protein [Candidatus Hydrogenedentes bacterium]|nr:glycoside hydrolase family 38 C-terminal domain-containing protein [Candidatus Hydrogenedentota bacterium]
MPKKRKVFVVPHTHWDRAWYVPFEEFRLRLVTMIDGLVRTLETDPSFTSFTLDGQAIALNDYLEIRPHNRDRLRRLIHARRLYVGPWYVLPDEFLVSPESLIRNLMLGRKISDAFGHTMGVGYVPDPFGHIAQLPQLLRGFGMDSFMFFRGIDQEATKLDVEFLWRGPDGAEVLCSQMRPFYGNGTHLGYATNWGDTEFMVKDFSFAIEQIETGCKLLQDHSVAQSLVLGNGIDQATHQADLPQILRRLGKRFPQYDFRIASFEEYIAQIRRELANVKLKTHRGEMMYQYGDLLRGVDSSRIYMKMLNQECEDLLEKWTEPICSAAWLAGCFEYPQDQLWHAWEELMKTHPHDDVCGASVDRVHAEAEMTLGRVHQVGHMLYRLALRRFALNTDNSKQAGAPVLAFNTLPTARKEVVRIDIDLVPYDEPWDSFALFDENGREVPYELLSVERKNWWEALKPFDVMRHAIELEIDLPPFGYRTLYVRKGAPRPVAPRCTIATKRFENSFYALSISANGSLTLYDKATKTTHKDLLVFEDVEDCGDEYNWSYLDNNSQTFTTAKSRPAIERVHAGPFSATWRITHEMKLPVSLTSDHKARSKKLATFVIESEVTCRAGSPRVDIVTRVNNNIKDHRVRALFPASIETDTVLADGHFAAIERAFDLPPAKPKLPPYPTQHQLRFSCLTDGKKGFAIINDGLPEYQVVRDKNRRVMAQTLFRSVGWLGREDVPTRRYGASPALAAPEAQCLRAMEFRYAFMAFKGDWTPVMQESLRHNIAPCVTRADVHGGTDLRQMGIEMDEERAKQKYLPVPREGKLPDHATMMDIGNDALVLSAVKKCEWNNHLIVRLYNPGPNTQKGLLALFRPIKKAYATDLYEKRVGAALRVAKGVLRYACGPYRIVTFEVQV